MAAFIDPPLRGTILPGSWPNEKGLLLKVVFVIPWYGVGIGGGAEAECRGLVAALGRHCPEMTVEVWTTCLKEFAADWNQPFHREGASQVEGVTVRRFQVTQVDRSWFQKINEFRLMPSFLEDLNSSRGIHSPLSKEEESRYIDCMVDSPRLVRHIERNYHHVDFFVFIPYMFATSVKGSEACLGKAVMIPCLHEERYAFMELYRKMMGQAVACLFHVPAEQRFAEKIYGIDKGRSHLIGEQVDHRVPQENRQSFADAHGLERPYLLYAGRKIAGKNLPELVAFYRALRQTIDLDLVIIGSGDLDFSHEPGVHDLGFLSNEAKQQAMAGALALCQPSLNESFSIVMMEAWLQGTPCFAHRQCAVTREHIEASAGGFVFGSSEELADGAQQLLQNDEMRRTMGDAGRTYVLRNYTDERVAKAFYQALQKAQSQSTSVKRARPWYRCWSRSEHGYR